MEADIERKSRGKLRGRRILLAHGCLNNRGPISKKPPHHGWPGILTVIVVDLLMTRVIKARIADTKITSVREYGSRGY